MQQLHFYVRMEVIRHLARVRLDVCVYACMCMCPICLRHCALGRWMTIPLTDSSTRVCYLAVRSLPVYITPSTFNLYVKTAECRSLNRNLTEQVMHGLMLTIVTHIRVGWSFCIIHANVEYSYYIRVSFMYVQEAIQLCVTK